MTASSKVVNIGRIYFESFSFIMRGVLSTLYPKYDELFMDSEYSKTNVAITG